jgi:hypothetical protein
MVHCTAEIIKSSAQNQSVQLRSLNPVQSCRPWFIVQLQSGIQWAIPGDNAPQPQFSVELIIEVSGLFKLCLKCSCDGGIYVHVIL